MEPLPCSFVCATKVRNVKIDIHSFIHSSVTSLLVNYVAQFKIRTTGSVRSRVFVAASMDTGTGSIGASWNFYKNKNSPYKNDGNIIT